MIINGEKVPAFSATTLSIPQTPADNFNAIVESSRALYARPRAEIEAEIRETIEQSEKYKKELSDSGREAGSMGGGGPVFLPLSQDDSVSIKTSNLRGFSAKKLEQKPNKTYSPQTDFRKAGLSPNAAEGKERLGLKDLAKLVEEKKAKPETVQRREDTPESPRKDKRKKTRKKGKITANNSPVASSPAMPDKAPIKATVITPVIEYQEKSATPVKTNEHSIDLSQAIRDPGKFAGQDNSMDGFLSIRH